MHMMQSQPGWAAAERCATHALWLVVAVSGTLSRVSGFAATSTGQMEVLAAEVCKGCSQTLQLHASHPAKNPGLVQSMLGPEPCWRCPSGGSNSPCTCLGLHSADAALMPGWVQRYVSSRPMFLDERQLRATQSTQGPEAAPLALRAIDQLASCAPCSF